MKNKEYTRTDLIQNARAYNKYLTFDYLEQLTWKQLICFVHPSLREEITGNRPFIN
jgi:hypothetical protein